mgnify:CR=1 FL=1
MKQKAILIKDFYNDKGALHVGEEVVIDEADGKIADGYWYRSCLRYSITYF